MHWEAEAYMPYKETGSVGLGFQRESRQFTGSLEGADVG